MFGMGPSQTARMQRDMILDGAEAEPAEASGMSHYRRESEEVLEKFVAKIIGTVCKNFFDVERFLFKEKKLDSK